MPISQNESEKAFWVRLNYLIQSQELQYINLQFGKNNGLEPAARGASVGFRSELLSDQIN